MNVTGILHKILTEEFETEHACLVEMVLRRPTYRVFTFTVPERFRDLGTSCGDQDGPDFSFFKEKLEKMSVFDLSRLYWELVKEYKSYD